MEFWISVLLVFFFPFSFGWGQETYISIKEITNIKLHQLKSHITLKGNIPKNVPSITFIIKKIHTCRTSFQSFYVVHVHLGASNIRNFSGLLLQADPVSSGVPYDKEFIVCSLDLLSGLAEGLGSGIESLVFSFSNTL